MIRTGNQYIDGWNDAMNPVTSLTAAVSNDARKDKAKQVAENTASGVDLVYQRWADKLPFKTSPRLLSEFAEELGQVMVRDLELYLEGAIARSLRSRGFPLPGPERLAELASKAARDAVSPLAVRDLFVRLQGATEADLGRYLGEANAFNRASHVALNASDAFEQLLYEDAVEQGRLTGARQWNVRDPQNSRHANLNGRVAGRGEQFRTKDGSLVSHPRPRGGNPKEWSNESSFLTYQLPNGRFV